MLKPSDGMKRALAEAYAAAERNEVPVGAAITDKAGKVIAAAGNRTRELNDPTAHAEILAIREVCQKLKADRLPDFDLHVTLEPCAMCATAISFARIRRLYFGAEDEKMGGVDNGPRIFAQATCHHAPEVYGGIGAAKASAILKDFFHGRRGGSSR